MSNRLVEPEFTYNSPSTLEVIEPAAGISKLLTAEEGYERVGVRMPFPVPRLRSVTDGLGPSNYSQSAEDFCENQILRHHLVQEAFVVKR